MVILWTSFGRNSPIGPPYNLGRTTTHEVGHYLGLEHTFNREAACGIATPPGCYTDGDLICDTNVEQNAGGSMCAVGAVSGCGSVDPTDNYMDYSDDQCMQRFTLEQIRRTRCSLENYRPNLYLLVGSNTMPQVTITAPANGSSTVAGAATDAEDGNLTASLAWTSSLDGSIGSGGSFSISSLSVGVHTITASVSDSGSLTGSNSIEITVTASCSTRGGTPAFSEDFEGGAMGWTTAGLWHLVDNSICLNPAYASATKTMYYGQDPSCDYDTGDATQGDLISPQISNLGDSSTVSFQYFRQVEKTEVDPYDTVSFSVSVLGESNWTELWTKSSLETSENTWVASGDISLAAYAGQTIEFRYRFDSVDFEFNGFVGWLLDDVDSADARVPKPMMGNGSQQDEKKTFAKGVDKTNLA